VNIVSCKVKVHEPPMMEDVTYTTQEPLISFTAPQMFADGLNQIECGFTWTYEAYERDTKYEINEFSEPVAFFSHNQTFTVYSD